MLLLQPKIYDFAHHLKNTYLIDFYLKQVHEPDFNALNLIFGEQSLLCLDIGANVGMSALSIFTLKPNAKVISFEPNPINYPYLDRLVEKFNNFQYRRVGLGKNSTSLDFYYPIYNRKHLTALGSCVRQQAEAWLSKETVYFYDPKKLEIKEMGIEVETLDSLSLQPDFVKIDVEGFEHQVLLGSAKTIETHRPILLIEGVAAGDEVHLKMNDWGYKAYRFCNNQFYFDEFDCDNNFFVPQEKINLIQPYLK